MYKSSSGSIHNIEKKVLTYAGLSSKKKIVIGTCNMEEKGLENKKFGLLPSFFLHDSVY